MVGEGSPRASYTLEQVLSEEHIAQILSQVVGDSSEYVLVCSEVRPAAEGLCGFLGEHLRALLHVRVGGQLREVHLFVKRVPLDNKPKAQFIHDNQYFKREKLMLHFINKTGGAEGGTPWGARGYLYTDSVIVMPDLCVAGYRAHPLLEPLDLRHVLLTAATLARYHAAFANYETNEILNATQPYDFYEKHKHLLVEPTLKNSPWLRTAAKLTTDLLNAFSCKYSKATVPKLEEKLAESYIDACESLRVAEGTLNVVVHKDLWNNNILFKYEGGVPTNAILIDFQCVRYGPPAFDVMSFLYLTTSRDFREKHEKRVLDHYWQVFSGSLEHAAKKRLHALGYCEKEFVCWCERSRKFGLVEAVTFFPQVLMEAREAQRVFDNPDTFLAVVNEDRSSPVVQYAHQHPAYTHRNLDVSEEYVERFILRLK